MKIKRAGRRGALLSILLAILSGLMIGALASPVAAASAPGPVQNLRTNVKSDRIEVKWARPSDDGDRRIREYEVFVAGPGFRTTRRDVDVQLPPPGKYTARVRARNSQGWGPWTETAPFQVKGTEKPSAPRSAKLSVRGGDDLRLTFKAPADDGGASIREYRVRLNGPGYSNTVATVGKKRTVNLKNVAKGLYAVEVAARNSEGWGPWSAAAEARIGRQEAPGRVRSISASVSDGTIFLHWTAPSSNGGAPVEGYVVRVNPGYEQFVETTGATLVGFNPGTYPVIVTARNSAGEGSATTVGATIAAPSVPERRVGPFPSPNAFVVRQYADLFDRPADASGLSFWSGQLVADGSNAPDVIAAMMDGQEFLPNQQVIRLYLAYFNRLPDNEGLNYWVRVLKQNGAPLDDVSEAFAASAEFRATYGPLGDADFAALVYNNVLLRQPDASGYAYWVHQLQAGLGRGDLMILFSDSVEFQRSSDPAVQTVGIFNSMLDRSPTASQFQYWVRSIGADPAATNQLVDQIFYGAEYRNRVL